VLPLTHVQKERAWKDLRRRAADQELPPGFSASVGWVLPNGVSIRPVTRRVDRDVPVLKPYDFAIVRGTLVIVNPADRIIAEVIPHQRVSAA
jgi:hypothetical protein